MRGKLCVAAPTRNRPARAGAEAGAGEDTTAAPVLPPVGGRGGSEGSSRPPSPPGDHKSGREIPVIVLDDDDDEGGGGGNSGDEGALHAAASRRGDNAPVFYPVATRTRSRTATFYRGGLAAAREAGGCCSSSSESPDEGASESSDGGAVDSGTESVAACSEGSVADDSVFAPSEGLAEEDSVAARSEGSVKGDSVAARSEVSVKADSVAACSEGSVKGDSVATRSVGSVKGDSVVARSEGSVEGSGGVASADRRSETAVSVHGVKEDNRAEGNRSVGDGGVVASSCGQSSQCNSGDCNLLSSGDSLSIHGDNTGGDAASGGGSLVSRTGTGTEQVGSQSLHASLESAPSGGGRGDADGERDTAEGGVATTSFMDSGFKCSPSRILSGPQNASGLPGRVGNELRNCIARRTRSKLFGDKWRTADYTSYFRQSESSDMEGEETDDSDSEGTRMWSPPSPASLLLSSSSSLSFESDSDAGHRSKGWTLNMETGVSGGRYSYKEHARKKMRLSRNGNLFCAVKNKNRVYDSGSIGSFRIAQRSGPCFSLKNEKHKEKWQLRMAKHPHCADDIELTSLVFHKDGEKNASSDEGALDKKQAGRRFLDDNACFEGKTKPSLSKKEQTAKRCELWIGKSRKRKRVKTLREHSLFKMFIDSIWGKAETLQEEFIPPKSHTNKSGEPLPLIFSFGDEDQKPVEKSEYEKELDDLWEEFDFVLNSNNIGSYQLFKCEHEEMDAEEGKTHLSTLCNKGHQLILDEQIGIRCKLCSFVNLEIRYILPSLAADRSEGIFTEAIWRSQDNLPLLDELFANKNRDSWGDAFKLSEGTVWNIIPGVKSTLYPHQQEAFEFLWRNLAGDIFLNKLKKSVSYDGLGGCVISHAPGTGKSRLTIVFLQAFLRAFPECRPVIVAPRGMLLTWKKEFEKWKFDIPVHVLNEYQFSGREDDVALRLVVGKHRKRQWSRIVKLYSWDKGRSVLALSYCLFEKLVGSFKQQGSVSADLGKILLDRPDLFVFDEGHTPRNERSLIWKALGKIRTERRIILSGTPFQNNFGELYNTFCLVRPKFADKISCDTSKFCQRKEFIMEKERDEGRGKWASLTSSINDERLEALRSMMQPFVHVHNGSSLRSLPGLKDCLIVLDPLPRQKNILEIVEDIRSDNVFAMEYKISLASVHPSLLTACTLSEKEISDIDVPSLNSIKLNPNEGVKTKFVMELVRLCQALNERVLVFGQYIEPLDLILRQLGPLFGWKEGTEILKMDGKMRPRHRQLLIDDFNDPKSKARMLLASIKACSEGISLTGASRVVLLDVVWNPSVERQAISRAYRLGQEKVVYIYHLITYGTREGDKYYKQVEKDRLSKLVFSSADGSKNVQDDSFSVSEDKILKEMVGHDKLKDMFKRILYQPKESNLIDAFIF